jgi:hypothetical protein
MINFTRWGPRWILPVVVSPEHAGEVVRDQVQVRLEFVPATKRMGRTSEVVRELSPDEVAFVRTNPIATAEHAHPKPWIARRLNPQPHEAPVESLKGVALTGHHLTSLLSETLSDELLNLYRTSRVSRSERKHAHVPIWRGYIAGIDVFDRHLAGANNVGVGWPRKAVPLILLVSYFPALNHAGLDSFVLFRVFTMVIEEPRLAARVKQRQVVLATPV